MCIICRKKIGRSKSKYMLFGNTELKQLKSCGFLYTYVPPSICNISRSSSSKVVIILDTWLIIIFVRKGVYCNMQASVICGSPGAKHWFQMCAPPPKSIKKSGRNMIPSSTPHPLDKVLQQVDK